MTKSAMIVMKQNTATRTVTRIMIATSNETIRWMRNEKMRAVKRLNNNNLQKIHLQILNLAQETCQISSNLTYKNSYRCLSL